MKRLQFLAVAGVTPWLLSACAPAPNAEASAESAELARMTSLKTAYQGVVMGFDIHGTEVDVSIDLGSMLSMDEDDEKAMKADILKHWRAAWLSAHPRKRAKVTVRVIDFRGGLNWSGSAIAK